MLASRPHDRYQTAEEAAEALAGLSSRKSAKGLDGARKAAPAIAPVEPVPAPPPPEPEYVEVRPEYPGWFRPLAELSERTSLGAFAILAVIGGCLFVLGLFVGMLNLWILPPNSDTGENTWWPHYFLVSFFLFAFLFVAAIVISLLDKNKVKATVETEALPKTNKQVKILFVSLGLVILSLYIIFNGH